MSVVRGVVEYVTCVSVWFKRCGWRGGYWMRGLGLGCTNPVGTGGVLDVCLCYGCGGVGGVGGEWVGCLYQGRDGWGGVMCV